MFAYIQDYFLGVELDFPGPGYSGRGGSVINHEKCHSLFYLCFLAILSTLLHHCYWVYQTSLLNSNPFPFNISIPSVAMRPQMLGESCMRIEAVICYNYFPSSFFTFNYKVFNTKMHFPCSQDHLF